MHTSLTILYQKHFNLWSIWSQAATFYGKLLIINISLQNCK